jgi:hypothetical protein
VTAVERVPAQRPDADVIAAVAARSPFPWAPGTATGIGSLPGTDIGAAVDVVLGEAPDLPYLPELPARGPGADMVGRTAGLLVDLPIELYAAQWRVAARPGRDSRRIADLWERDLDALTERADAFDGLLKTQVVGPWTLAATLDLRIGGRMLRDRGAVRDLTASLAEGVAAHVRDLRARLPHARVLLQLDEPTLPAVLDGRVPTESGYGVLAAVEADLVADALRDVIAAAGTPAVVHCCAPRPPLELLRRAGAAAVAIDLDLFTDYDALGETLEAGIGLFGGAVSTSGSRPVNAAEVAQRVRDLWKMIGFSINRLPEQVVITPACGLAGATRDRARAVMTACREAARRLADD